MKIDRITSALCALALLCLTNVAVAQDAFFTTNATINYAINGYAYVGYDSSFTVPASPTVGLVAGGSIDFEIQAYNSSILNVLGGTIGESLTGFDDSVINMSGGTVGLAIYSKNSSVLNIRGGSIANRTYAFDASTLNFYGTGLSSTLIDPNNTFGNYSLYQLSGLLEDGSDVTGKYLYLRNDGTPTVNFIPTQVPEPGSMALLCGLTTASVFVLRRRRN